MYWNREGKGGLSNFNSLGSQKDEEANRQEPGESSAQEKSRSELAVLSSEDIANLGKRVETLWNCLEIPRDRTVSFAVEWPASKIRWWTQWLAGLWLPDPIGPSVQAKKTH